MAEKKSSGKNKQVANHPPMGSREESFGGAPGEVAIGGGTMHMFGHRKKDSGVWPSDPVTPNSKTGYPQGWDGRSIGPKAGKN